MHRKKTNSLMKEEETGSQLHGKEYGIPIYALSFLRKSLGL